MLERVWEIDEIRLGGIVQQRPELGLDVAATLRDQVGHETRVVGHGVEAAAVAAEAALIRQRPGDVVDVHLARVGLERVEPATAHGLDVRTRLHPSRLDDGGLRA